MPGLHVSELGRSWNDLVKNIQRRPFDILTAFVTTPFAVPAACCVEKRKRGTGLDSRVELPVVPERVQPRRDRETAPGEEIEQAL